MPHGDWLEGAEGPLAASENIYVTDVVTDHLGHVTADLGGTGHLAQYGPSYGPVGVTAHLTGHLSF